MLLPRPRSGCRQGQGPAAATTTEAKGSAAVKVKGPAVVKGKSPAATTKVKLPAVTEVQRKMLSKDLEGLKVRYELPWAEGGLIKQQYKVLELRRKSAKEEMFNVEGRKTSVAEYFKEHHKVDFELPGWPRLWVGSRDRTIFLPVEVGRILAQPLPRKKNLPDDAVAKRIKSTAVKPLERHSKTLEGLRVSKHLGDMEMVITTQCYLRNKLFKQDKLNTQVVANICLKTNAKLGGINHVPAETCLPKLLHKPVMIMGEEVSHPAPESCRSKPSIVAVVSSVEPQAAQYEVQVRIQDMGMDRNEVVIQDLKDVTIVLLKKCYEKKNGRMPERLVIFRDGVSKGQFLTVLAKEVVAMTEAEAPTTTTEVEMHTTPVEDVSSPTITNVPTNAEPHLERPSTLTGGEVPPGEAPTVTAEAGVPTTPAKDEYPLTEAPTATENSFEGATRTSLNPQAEIKTPAAPPFYPRVWQVPHHTSGLTALMRSGLSLPPRSRSGHRLHPRGHDPCWRQGQGLVTAKVKAQLLPIENSFEGATRTSLIPHAEIKPPAAPPTYPRVWQVPHHMSGLAAPMRSGLSLPPRSRSGHRLLPRGQDPCWRQGQGPVAAKVKVQLLPPPLRLRLPRLPRLRSGYRHHPRDQGSQSRQSQDPCWHQGQGPAAPKVKAQLLPTTPAEDESPPTYTKDPTEVPEAPAKVKMRAAGKEVNVEIPSSRLRTAHELPSICPRAEPPLKMPPAKFPAKVKIPAEDETPADHPTRTAPAEVQVLVPTQAEGHTLNVETKTPAASVQRSYQHPASAPASV